MSAKWDRRFLDRAIALADWSKDATKVGAVIYDSNNRPVSEGYNGLPRGLPDDTEIYALDTRIVIHAEVNAILFARRDLTGCTLYVSQPTCALCAALIIQSGISRVVYPKTSLPAKWNTHKNVAEMMYKLANIEVHELN